MGFERHATFERQAEWKEAHLCEVEFAEMARALKALAEETGRDAGPLLDELARHGLGGALALLAQNGLAGAAQDYWRLRSRGTAE